ncbi:hypothetical protein [Neptunomonas antarctica]|uniref:Nickel/cobalt transporter regulator n=1 Tax=Neptunomonas antarctica TaxID=619304 RepID=A0A1N7MW06_9GAMM|nr:hypothetical protein [Neptunomonas antarctica]SIS90121.1 hypothetical protein SAMN05421760_10751 [Neptunomonas antarctica]
MTTFSNRSSDNRSSLRLIVMGVVLALMSGGAFADKKNSEDKGKNKEKKHQSDNGHGDRDDKGRDDYRRVTTVYFDNHGRRVVSEYYSHQERRNHCPPGLKKKNNGCQPPGQAKKWHKGRPLAEDTVYYELPQELLIRLPVPPVNHRYVRVAGDILMVTIGTSLVVDAIEDILR